ncbi:hypothetical protein [Terribacillus saccharophilus]|uniref:hypothetical protein n=1 Tax=Terribacillus saccharophilus TaxID=361277 RepID=UPI002989DFA0|nr:hypothetical protein [Terribacillus saccharophilus]MCM3225752.1 hypothetical protein [Terribacillus saccharophilus]
MIEASRNRVILDELVELYEKECIKELETVKKDIVDIFKDVLDNNKNKYDLIFTNSVYKGEYYKFSSRVKSKESISEKLVRSSDLLYLIQKYNLTNVGDIQQNKKDIIKFFNSYEDIIGLKIIGELIIDTENIYDLIREKVDEFLTKDINIDGLLPQPIHMKNGLPIYKLKCTYKNIYAFELQFKSQLQSAWGDMEHQLFYKDYNFTPVKSSAQSIMNEVGHLLQSVDNLLYKIRVAESNYQSEEEFSLFTNNIHKAYSEVIKDFLDIPHEQNLISLSHLLYDLYKVFFEDRNAIRELSKTGIDYRFIGFSVEETGVLKNFESIKALNLDIQILEFIILNWLKYLKVYNDDELTYSSSLKYFFNVYQKYICEKYLIPDDDEYYPVIFERILSNVSNKKAFMGAVEFGDIANYYKLSHDLFSDEEESSTLDKDKFNLITVIYAVYKFDKDLEKIRKYIQDVFYEDYTILNSHYEKMKEHIEYIHESDPNLYISYEPFITANKNIINILNEMGSDEE